jgi:uncharacterized protein (TIGR00369 family)
MTETQVVAAGAVDGVVRTRTYAWSDPAASAGQVVGLSGVEVFAALNSGAVPLPPILATLDIENVVVVAEGQVTVEMRAQEFHYNPIGSMHGGVISALLDTAAGCSVHTTLPAGMGYTSLDLNVRFLKAVTVQSGKLRCEGVVVSRGRQTALAEARLYDEAGRLVAHATSTCLLFPMPAA